MILASFLRSPFRFVGRLFGLVKDADEAISSNPSDNLVRGHRIRGGETSQESGRHSSTAFLTTPSSRRGGTRRRPLLLRDGRSAREDWPGRGPELIQVLVATRIRRSAGGRPGRWVRLGPGRRSRGRPVQRLGRRASVCWAGRQRSDGQNWWDSYPPFGEALGR